MFPTTVLQSDKCLEGYIESPNVEVPKLLNTRHHIVIDIREEKTALGRDDFI